MYVCPGGRVDPDDAGRPAASELRAHVTAQLTARASQRRARALAIACLRETQEETGLALGRGSGDGFLPALHRLDYVGRAITPAGSPIRYHARFFHAAIDDAVARDALLRNGELLDLEWRRFEDALALPMLDVTAFMLRAVAQRLGHPAGRHDDAPTQPGAPFVRYRSEARHITYE